MKPDDADGREAAAGGPAPGTVTIERHAPAAAIVSLRGAHDLTTQAAIDDALARAGAESHVLVDLSECSFIDSTVIGALVLAYQSFSERGRRLELAIPPGAAAIQRVATVAGLTTFLTIHETRADGLQSLSAH